MISRDVHWRHTSRTNWKVVRTQQMLQLKFLRCLLTFFLVGARIFQRGVSRRPGRHYKYDVKMLVTHFNCISKMVHYGVERGAHLANLTVYRRQNTKKKRKL